MKADANPGVDNVAYVRTKNASTFQIRCAELCGLWHGYMYDTGRVVSPADFETWIAARRSSSRRCRSTCRSTRLPTRPTRPSAPDEPPPSARVQPPDGGRARRRRLLRRLVARASRQGAEPRLLRRHRARTTSRCSSRTSPASSASSSGSASRTTRSSECSASRRRSARRRPAGIGRYFGLCTDHKVVGHPVPDRDRRLHLHRRPERDADPLRASAADASCVERQQLPHARRPPRHDDDGDDDERDPRPVRQLLRAADDRDTAHGVPAHRGADVLAADGCRARS